VDTLEKGSSFEINRAISYLLAICFIKISQMLSSKKGRKPAMCCLKWSVPSFWSFQKWTLCQGRFQSPRHPQKMTKGTKRPIGIIMVGFLKGWWSCRLLFCFFLRFRFFLTQLHFFEVLLRSCLFVAEFRVVVFVLFVEGETSNSAWNTMNTINVAKQHI